MIEQIYKKLFFLTNLLYLTKINNDKELEKKIQIEDEEYKKLNHNELSKLYDFLDLLSMNEGIDFFPNYELAHFNEKDYLIIKRMQEKTFMYLNNYVNYDDKKSKKYKITIDEKKVLIVNNYEQALSEIYLKILNCIDARFLYLLNNSNEITDETKTIMNKNYLFINPYLENTSTMDIIKGENKFYNELWDSFKLEYDTFLKEYLITNISAVMNIMLYDTLNDIEENSLNEIYLRTLFNFLDFN